VIYIFDACAVIAFLDKEKGGEKVEDLLNQSRAGKHNLYMHMVNLIEVYYGYIRDMGREKANAYMEPIGDYTINFIRDIPDSVYHQAAFLKGTYHISLGDSIACATAKTISATLVTADHGDLEEIEEKEKIPMYWIRPKPYNA
jgi:predicted nucleic acid-binding protein